MIGTKIILELGHTARGIKKCIGHHISDPRSPIATCCTTCVICGEAIGSSIMYTGPEPCRVYYHQGCTVCPTDSHCLRSPQVKLNGNNIEVYLDCRHVCKTCNMPLAKKVPYIDLDGQYVHNRCTKASICTICCNSYNTKNLITDGGLIRHRDCMPEICTFCSNPVPFRLHLGPLGEEVKKHGKKAHSECLVLQKCSNCGLHDNDMLYDGKEFKHAECVSESCPICKKTIGKSVFVKFNVSNTPYHHACLEQQKCIACNRILNQGVIRTNNGKTFYHSECDISSCSECLLPIGRTISRIINNVKYHMGCGPKCKICNVARENDSKDLKMVEKGVYLHEVCTTEPCLLCGTPLGHPSNTFTRKFVKGVRFVHKVCLDPCLSCGGQKINIKRKELPRLDAKNRPFLRSDIKETFTSLLVGIKYGNVPSAKKVPKDVLFLILEEIVKKSPHGYASLPFVLNGEVDMRRHCNQSRCAGKHCRTCGKFELKWSSEDYTRCNNTMCILKFKAMRRIVTDILGLSVEYDWPETTSMSFIGTTFLKEGWKLSPEKVSLYNGMVASLNMI